MKEKLLHTIWDYVKFDVSTLLQEHQISVLNQGVHNFGDGPDFLDARIRIGSLLFFGDVEIHCEPSQWYSHKHHLDKRYNRVVLHVVYSNPDPTATSVIREDGTEIPQIELKGYLPESITTLVEQLDRTEIPCAGNIKYLNASVPEKLIRQMHEEYFEFKAEQMMQVYPSHLPVTQAWVYLFQRFVFEACGYISNTKAMQRLFEILSTHPDFLVLSPSDVLQIAGLSDEYSSASPMKRQDWDYSGCRPQNQPPVRIAQALQLSQAISHFGWAEFVKGNPQQNWQRLLGKVPDQSLPGKKRLSQIYTMVYLPSVYILGVLSGNQSLKISARQLWLDAKADVPESIKRKYSEAGWPDSAIQNTGLTHLYKRYCSRKRCGECFLLKAAINS